MDQRLGYRCTLNTRVVRKRHEIGFANFTTASRLIELLAKVPPSATVSEVLTDEDDEVSTICFTEENPCE
jgi:hypothetical protein